jgi:hypothetical protein
MSTPANRPAGLYGRRPPKRHPAIQFSAIRRAAPVTPAAVDYLSPLGGGWLMLGNGPDDSVFPGFQGCGDCVAAWWANTRRMISTVIAGTPAYPPWSQVLAVYQTQNPQFDPAGNPDTTGPGSSADGGMDIQTLLEFLVATPGFGDGGTLVGFAAVDFTNIDEVKAAIAAGGVLCVGINVQDAQMDQFNGDEPWNWVSGSPLDGGHCTAVGGYGAAPAGSDPAMAGDEKFITWAAETSFTDLYWGNGVEELWFPIWAEQLGTTEFQAGVDMTAFAAEYTAITGKPFPATVPPVPVPPAPPGPPVPVPPAPPGPVTADAADEVLWTAVRAWAVRWADSHELEAMFADLPNALSHPHIISTRKAARDAIAWAEAKGLPT